MLGVAVIIYNNPYRLLQYTIYSHHLVHQTYTTMYYTMSYAAYLSQD